MAQFNNLVLSTKNIDDFIHAVADEVVRKIESRKASYEPIVKPPATRKEAAKFLGVSLPTLDILIKTNQLQAFNIGRQVRVNWNDLEKFLKKKGGKA